MPDQDRSNYLPNGGIRRCKPAMMTWYRRTGVWSLTEYWVESIQLARQEESRSSVAIVLSRTQRVEDSPLCNMKSGKGNPNGQETPSYKRYRPTNSSKILE